VIVAQAPFRVSLLGGGSDFPEHFTQYGGAVVGGSINRYCFVSVRTRPQSFGTTYRVRYSRVDEGSLAQDISHPAVRYLLQHFEIDNPLDLNHSSDLPSRSGIGSSSAFLAAAYAGLSPSSVAQLSPYEIAGILTDIERQQLHETCGMQDAIFSVFGGVNLIEFSDDGFVVQPSTASRAYLNDLASHCFLVYLGNERLSSTQQRELVRNLPAARNILGELAQMARETFAEINAQTLEPKHLGDRVNLGWELKKTSSPRASSEEIEQLHEELRRFGAWGGKILGAGGSGFYLSVAPKSVRKAFEDSHANTVICDFQWDFGGLNVKRV